MKSYSKKLLLLPAAALMTIAGLTGCSEEATLSGAKAVYIELSPSANISMHIGDTTRVSARVTNVNGDEIITPVSWSVDDASAVEVLEDSIPGSTLITCGDGSQGKKVTLRATLENDAYAVANVSIVKAAPEGVNPVTEDGTVYTEKRVWDIQHDSIIFAVEPRLLLLDYDPVCDFDGMEPVGENGGVVIDRKHGLVTLHYSAGKIAQDHYMSVAVGSGAGEVKGVCKVSIIPDVEGATFYGPAYADLPYLGSRPPQGTLSMWYAYTYENTIDINSTDTIRVAINVSGGIKEDIEQAYKCYHWEAVEGNSVMKILDTQEYCAGNGFDAVLAVRAGLETGTTVFHCVTPDTVLVATINVRDFVKEFPVESITCSHSSVETIAGVANAVVIKMGTIPMSSFGIHKPKPVVDDPSIISLSEYNGDELTITGLKPGTTNIRFTSNQAPEFVLPVTITDGYRSITYTRNDTQIVFAGQDAVWNTNVETLSGEPNERQVTFETEDASIATVTNVEGTLNQATFKGISAGKAKIKASVADVSVERVLTVVAPDASGTFTNASDLQLTKSGKNLRVRLPSGGLIAFAGAYNSAAGYDGTYDVADYDVTYTLSNAKANVVSGTLTVAPGSSASKKVVTFNFVVELSDGVTLNYSANALEIEAK